MSFKDYAEKDAKIQSSRHLVRERKPSPIGRDLTTLRDYQEGEIAEVVKEAIKYCQRFGPRYAHLDHLPARMEERLFKETFLDTNALIVSSDELYEALAKRFETGPFMDEAADFIRRAKGIFKRYTAPAGINTKH